MGACGAVDGNPPDVQVTDVTWNYGGTASLTDWC